MAGSIGCVHRFRRASVGRVFFQIRAVAGDEKQVVAARPGDRAWWRDPVDAPVINAVPNWLVCSRVRLLEKLHL